MTEILRKAIERQGRLVEMEHNIQASLAALRPENPHRDAVSCFICVAQGNCIPTEVKVVAGLAGTVFEAELLKVQRELVEITAKLTEATKAVAGDA